MNEKKKKKFVSVIFTFEIFLSSFAEFHFFIFFIFRKLIQHKIIVIIIIIVNEKSLK